MAESAEILSLLLRDSKFGEAVRELDAAFDRIERPSVAPLHLTGKGDFSNLEMERLAPPSRIESAFFQRLLDGVFKNERTLALHPWATGILIALEAGVPFARLIADRPQLTFRSLALDEVTQSWFFIPVLEQEDVGHLSPYVFRLPAQSLSVDHVCRRFRLLRSGQSKKIEQFLNSQLLGSRRDLHTQIGKAVSKLLSRPGDSVTLSARTAIRLLDRLSCQLCSHYQPGSIAASLRGALPFGINHVAVEQVIETMTGRAPRLVDLVGNPWQAWTPTSHRRPTKALLPTYQDLKERLTRHRAQFAAAVRRHPVGTIIRLFVANRLVPARARFRDLLSVAGIEGSKAEAISRSVYVNLRTLGNLALTKPARMCSPETLSRLTGRIANVAPALRYFWGTTRAERIRLRERAVQQLTLCTFAGDRVGETVALQPGEVCSGPYGNFVYIYDGKTKSARRAVHVEHIGESPALSLSPLVDGQLPEKERSVAMRLRRLLAKLMPLSLHDLRRSRAWAALVKALEQVYPSGSLVEFLATLARQYGHCSLITFLHSYVGGMLAKLALPPIDWRCVRWISPVKNLRGRIPELLRLYDGSAHAIDQLQAQVKRTRAHKRGNGIGTSRCWIGEHRFRVQHLRWCDSRSGAVVWPKPLPDRPDLPEFWIAIGEMKEIADARGVSLLFTVRVKTRDKHRDRFASLLGPDCFAGGV